MIKVFRFIIAAISLLWLTCSSCNAQLAKDEAAYQTHSTSIPSPGLVLEDDAIIQFDLDVTGDGKPERFFSKDSLRDGKMGHIWSIYSVDPSGAVRLIGEETFRHDALSPTTMKSDQTSFGFYSYFPGGAGRGLLSFFKVDGNRISRLEKREIEPNGADKAEFDGLFAARLTGESPKIELKRTALPTPQNTTAPSNAVNASPDTRETTPPPKPPPVVQQPTPKAAESKPTASTPSEEPTSSTPWSIIVVLIVAALGLLWLVLKRRS